jgi:hypothetical protein
MVTLDPLAVAELRLFPEQEELGYRATRSPDATPETRKLGREMFPGLEDGFVKVIEEGVLGGVKSRATGPAVTGMLIFPASSFK